MTVNYSISLLSLLSLSIYHLMTSFLFSLAVSSPSSSFPFSKMPTAPQNRHIPALLKKDFRCKRCFLPSLPFFSWRYRSWSVRQWCAHSRSSLSTEFCIFLVSRKRGMTVVDLSTHELWWPFERPSDKFRASLHLLPPLFFVFLTFFCLFIASSLLSLLCWCCFDLVQKEIFRFSKIWTRFRV